LLPGHRPAPRGFTLLELLAVLAIIGALALLAVPVFETVRSQAERIVCINNLRNLHAAFSSYSDGSWPQVPEGTELGSVAEQKWWLEKSEKDLGLSKKNWQCPTIRRLFAKEPEKDRPLIHYLPTTFTAEPNKANQWPEMPWFVEIGDAHGQGNLLVRQNGTVEPAPR
jgi:prepilin-type N-terminal cleavage/methylation domain-containing protein